MSHVKLISCFEKKKKKALSFRKQLSRTTAIKFLNIGTRKHGQRLAKREKRIALTSTNNWNSFDVAL